MVVGGVIESRGGLFIKKVNEDAELSNSVSNRKAKVDDDYTSLDLNTREGKVNFISNNKDSFNTSQNTSFIFSAFGASTKLGINTTDTPIATLDVVGDTAISQALILGMNDYMSLESPDLDPSQAMIV